MKKIIPIAVLSWLVLFSNCSKNLPDPGATASVKMANEWWVTVMQDGADVLAGDHIKVSTYNTSANDDSIWVDDNGNFWTFKAKAAANYQSLSFSTDSSQNDYYDIRVKIANGKMFPGQGISRTGNTTDSVYMEVEFTDDPGTVYVISGVARTMYAQDDYH